MQPRQKYFIIDENSISKFLLDIAKGEPAYIFFPFENGAPSHDSFGAVFAKIDRKQFGNLFIEWVEALQERIPALDGKTVRRTRNGEIPPVHIISAWASDQELVIGQIKTDVKSNEITAIPELLKMLKLENALVSIDAIGCQKSIAQEIVSQKAD